MSDTISPSVKPTSMTEFGVFWKGNFTGVSVPTMERAMGYIDGGVTAGNERTDYEVRCRYIIRWESEWTAA